MSSDPRAETLRSILVPQRAERLEAVLSRRTRHLTVVLENLYDSHNMSAVLRTADAFGLQEVHVVDPEGDFAISRKITQGAHKWLDVRRHEGSQAALDAAMALRARGFTLFAATLAEGAAPLTDLDLSGPAAFVFGNEHAGLSPALADACDRAYVIPMLGFVQSFNVSVSAALTLQHARGARRWPGLEGADREEVRERWLGLALKQSERILAALDDPP